MPNGESWDPMFDVLEEPMRCIDGTLEQFADRKNAVIIQNYHGLPGRKIVVDHAGGLNEHIDISAFMRDGSKGWTKGNYAYIIAVCVYRDAKEGRYASHKEILRTEDLPREPEEVIKLLEQCWAEIQELKKGLPKSIEVIERDTHIDDPAFAAEAVKILVSLIKAKEQA